MLRGAARQASRRSAIRTWAAGWARPRSLGRDIVRGVHDALERGGVFVAYQVRDRVKILGSEVFGRPRTDMVLLKRAADARLPLGEAA
jgi:hypothetical protein